MGLMADLWPHAFHIIQSNQSSCTQNFKQIFKMSEENTNIGDFWGVSTSYVWKNFGFRFEIIDGKKVFDKSKAVCRICKTDFKYHGGKTG